MYQKLPDLRPDYHHAFLTLRGLHDYLYDVIHDAKTIQLQGPTLIHRDLRRRQVRYHRYELQLESSQGYKVIQLDFRIPEEVYQDGDTSKCDHYLKITFLRGVIDHDQHQYFFTSPEGKYWCYKTGNKDKVIYTPSYTEEAVIGVLSFFKGIPGIDAALITYQQPKIIIDGRELNKCSDEEAREDNKIIQGYGLEDVYNTLVKVKKQGFSSRVISTQYGYVTSLLTVKADHEVYDIKIQARSRGSGYQKADPYLSIFLPRGLYGRVNYVCDIMDDEGRYLLRDRHFHIVKRSPQPDHKTIHDLTSLLKDMGIKGQDLCLNETISAASLLQMSI